MSLRKEIKLKYGSPKVILRGSKPQLKYQPERSNHIEKSPRSIFPTRKVFPFGSTESLFKQRTDPYEQNVNDAETPTEREFSFGNQKHFKTESIPAHSGGYVPILTLPVFIKRYQQTATAKVEPNKSCCEESVIKPNILECFIS